MSGTEMNKYQLIAGMIGDLGDKDRGLQVQGYQNMKIVTDVIEALVALKEGLQRDEKAMRELVYEKDKQIAELRENISALVKQQEEQKRSEAQPAKDKSNPVAVKPEPVCKEAARR